MSNSFDEELKDEFRDELYKLYKKTAKELYYSATFWVALGQENWLGYIKNFIINPHSAGIEKLIKANRPDLSIEYIIINNEKYHPLFTDEELEICKETLNYLMSSK